MLIWIIVAVIVLIALCAITLFNGLVAKRNRVQSAWSQIDVQLKRRHDLIPNLVNAVRGYMQHERALLERVTIARTNAISAGDHLPARAAAENALTTSVRSVFAVAEAYPVLKADGTVLALQEELTSTENRVSFVRQHYNDTVTEYNTARGTFPAVLLSGALGFAPREFFALDDPAQRAVPPVRLS